MHDYCIMGSDPVAVFLVLSATRLFFSLESEGCHEVSQKEAQDFITCRNYGYANPDEVRSRKKYSGKQNQNGNVGEPQPVV